MFSYLFYASINMHSATTKKRSSRLQKSLQMKVNGVNTLITVQKKGDFIHFRGSQKSGDEDMNFYINRKNNKFYDENGQIIGTLKDLVRKKRSSRRSSNINISSVKLDAKETKLSIKITNKKADLKSVEKQVRNIVNGSNSIEYAIKRQNALFNNELKMFAIKAFCFATTCVFLYYSGLLDKLFGVVDKVVDKVFEKGQILAGVYFFYKRIIAPFFRRRAGMRG